MNKITLNVLVNFGLMVIFVLLANNTLSRGLEETLVWLMLIYGIIVILINAIFIKIICKKINK